MKHTFVFGNLMRAADAGEQSGGGNAATTALPSQPQAGARPYNGPAFDPRINIDARDRNAQNSRLPNFQPVTIVNVTRFVDRKGNPRVAFNNAAIILSLAQLNAQGIFYPEVLQGKTMMVDFFIPGDYLLNGTQVDRSGIIVNRFMVEQDMEVARTLQAKFAEQAHTNWSSLANFAYGANNRGRGQGTGQNTNNGVVGVANIPQMQNPADSANATGSPSAALNEAPQLNKTGNDLTDQTEGNKTGTDQGAGKEAGTGFEQPE